MEKQDITVSQAHARIGDAAVNLFRISLNKPRRKDGGRKLIHEHMFYECHLLLRGMTGFVIGEHTIYVQERQLLIIPPKQGHQPFASASLQSDASECVFGLTLEPTEGEICCYPYFYAALQQAACTPISLSDELYDRLLKFLDGFDEQGGGLRAQCRQLTGIYPLLYSLFDAIKSFELPPHSEWETQNSDTNVTLDWLFDERNCSLSDIACILGYSNRHTARKIKEIYGESLFNVRRTKMLSSAKALLIQNPQMTLQSVARYSGFLDMQAMIRAFHSVENMTPTEYREKMLYSDNGESET